MCTGTHPYIPADRTALVTLNGTQHGSEVEMTFAFIKSTEWSASDLDGLVDAFIDRFWTPYADLISSDFVIRNVTAIDLGDEHGPQSVNAAPTPTAGQRSTPAAPNNVTLAVTKNTSLRGRSYRGRNYLVGLCLQDITGDTIDPAWVTSVVDVFDGITGPDQVVTGAELAVVSYCQDNAWLTTAVVTSVVACQANNVLDSQRRRLLGRGV